MAAYRRPFVGDDLWIARPDGTNRQRLTCGNRSEEIGPIHWSRDGQTILYTHMVEKGGLKGPVQGARAAGYKTGT